MHSENSTRFPSAPEFESLWNPLDPAGSEAAFRSVSPENTDPSSTLDQTNAIILKCWIARSEALQGKLDESLATLEGALKILEAPEATYGVSAKIRWLIERSRLYILQKTPSQAKNLLSESWTLAVNSGEDHFAVEIAQMLAESESPKTQQKWLEQAIQIAETSPQEKAKAKLGTLFTALGWKLFSLRQLEQALAMFHKAVSHLKAHGTERESFVARWSIGKVLRAQGKTEEALAIQKALLSEIGIGGRREGRLYEELAECLHTLKRTTEAQLYFELAYRELASDEWISDNQPVELKRMKDLGKVK